MACAKFCSDIIPYNGVTLKPIFHRIWIMMEKLFMKWPLVILIVIVGSTILVLFHSRVFANHCCNLHVIDEKTERSEHLNFILCGKIATLKFLQKQTFSHCCQKTDYLEWASNSVAALYRIPCISWPQVSEHAELGWILGCHTTLPRLQHLPQWKVGQGMPQQLAYLQIDNISCTLVGNSPVYSYISGQWPI